MKRTTAPNSSAGLFVDRVPGVNSGTISIAEDRNNTQEEICNTIESLGITLDGAIQTQLKRAVIGWSKPVGELFMMETDDTPGTFFPAVKRNVNNDITFAAYPLLTTKLRAEKSTFGGTSNFTGTVSGSRITFSGTADVIKMLATLTRQALVSGYLNQNQAAAFTADFTTSATQKCINIAGVDYPITNVNTVSYYIDVTGTPTAGSQTASFYPYRIAGSTTTARLHRLTGFVPAAAGDYDGLNVAGWLSMDQVQGHGHTIYGSSGAGGAGTWARVNAALNNDLNASFATNTTSNNVDGTPRIGKTTEPKSAAMYFFTWAGVMN